ncbi:hypothetical protein J6590_041014 [Homalodisca vitripennis]|nr:hypothetical protein J6590_041014 [Homalodisca vitripennis]
MQRELLGRNVLVSVENNYLPSTCTHAYSYITLFYNISQELLKYEPSGRLYQHPIRIPIDTCTFQLPVGVY